nr:hypothetical protein [Tanacetum cinerariifolium]
MSYGDSPNYSSSTTYSVPSNSKTGSNRSALITVDTLVDWTNHDSESNGVIAAKEFGMIDGCDSEDAIKEGAAKLYNLITGANSEEAKTIGDAGEFALMGVTSERVLQRNQLTLEDKIRVLSIELENTSNLLKHSKRINADFKTAKKDLQTKLDNHLEQTEKWRNSSKNLFKLIDSSMSVRTKVCLGFTNCISKNKLGWDDSTFSVFTTNSKDVAGRPIFHRFAKNDSMKAVPPPLSGDYTSLSDHIDLDESQMSYGTKSSTSCDYKSVSNNFVSCDNSDKSSEVNTNDFASSDSSVKSLEHKPNDSTSCASTSSVSTSMNEAEIESNVGTPIKEPISAGHFRKNASSVSKLCFVCGSGTHLIKDCDFYEKQMANKTVGIRVGPTVRPQPVPTSKPLVKPVPTGKPKVTPVPTGKLTVTPVSTGKPKVTPVPTGKPKENPFLTTTDEGIFDSGCSRRMIGNKERLDDFQAFQVGKVTFGGDEGRITGQGTIRTPTLDFENVYYDFKLPDDSMVVLRVPRKHNLYSINLNNLCPMGNLACLVAHASFDEFVKWNRRMDHVNYKNMNRLVKGNLVRGLPPKFFKNGHTCVACCKAHKVETYPILKDFINLVENKLNKKIKAIRCDNGTEFKNVHIIELCGSKGIKRESSNPRTLQQNRVAKSDHLGKFDGKADEGYIVGYSASNKAYRVYNVPNKKVEESMNLSFSEGTTNVQGLGHEWYFDLDYLTNSLGYKHVPANQSAGTQGAITTSADQEQRVTSDAESLGLGFANNDEELRTQTSVKTFPSICILVPTGTVPVPTGSLPVPTGSIPVPAAATTVSTDDVLAHTHSSTDLIFDDEPTTRFPCPSDLGNQDPSPGIFSYSSYDDESGDALNNVSSSVEVSPVTTKRINTIHPPDPTSVVQTRSKVKQTTPGDSAFISSIFDQQRDNHTDFQHCLFACFLSQVEPRSVAQALDDPSWVNMLLGLSILKNKRDARGIVVHNKARLVAQGHCQEEDPQHPKKVYKVVKALYGLHQALRAWYATLSTFLLKHGYRRGTIDKTLFLKKNSRDIILVQVYVDDTIFGSTKKAWCDEFEALMKGEFQMSAMGELTFFIGLQVQQRPDGIFIHQHKYVQEILNKFDLGSVRMATTSYEATKPKSKNKSDSPVNVHLYKSMIGLLMYLTTSRPDIMFAVSACSRHQVTPTTSNLEAVKKIFKYLKGQPKLGLWYLKESPLVLQAYSDSDYARANKDRKSTTGGCQFLGRWLISWQCKKQTIVATSSTETEYVAAANCCAQTLNPTSLSIMAALRYKDEHNKLGYLLKPIGSDDYHQIIDFLSASHIRAPELGPPAILAMIDKTPYTITEDLVRSRLQLADDGGIADLPIAKIYSGMDHLGYVTKGKLTFFKNKFSPQWRGMVSNIGNAKKFLMYLRFLQTILGIETRVTRHYMVLVFSSKLFGNIRLNFVGHPMPLLPTMLLQAQAGEVLEHGQSSDPHTTSFSQAPETDAVPFTTMKDAPMGGDFHTSPPRSSHASLAGQPSGGEADPITLTALSFVVCTLVQKVHTLESELQDHKKFFKDVVGKLVKKVKTLEVKLKTKKRKLVVSDSDQEDGDTQHVDLDALHALANAAVTVNSDIPSGSSLQILAASLSVPTVGPPGTFAVPLAPSDVPPGPSEVPTGALTVPAGSPTVPTDTLLGDHVSKDNFPARMAALIKKKRQALAEQLFKERRNRTMTQAQQKAYMRQYVKNQKPSSTKLKSPKAPTPSMPKVPLSPAISSPLSSRTRRKSLGQKHMHKPKSTLLKLDLDAPAQTFLKVLPTPLGEINSLYHIDGGKGSCVWQNQYMWEIRSWRLYTLSNVHVLETVSGEVLSMFTDVFYPLSVKLMERMLMHKLEIDSDNMGNDLTTAEQLIQFIKNQLVATHASSV